MNVLFALIVGASPVIGDHPLDVPVLLEDAVGMPAGLPKTVTASLSESLESAGLHPAIHRAGASGCHSAPNPAAARECASRALAELSPFRAHDVGVWAVITTQDSLRLSSINLATGATDDAGTFRLDGATDDLVSWFEHTLRPRVESAGAASDKLRTPSKAPFAVLNAPPSPPTLKKPSDDNEPPVVVTEGLSPPHKVIAVAGAAEVLAGASMLIAAVVASNSNTSPRFVIATDASSTKRYYRAGSIPLAPVGGALLIAGGVSSLGSLLFENTSPWWSVLAGHVLATGALSIALAVEDPLPEIVRL